MILKTNIRSFFKSFSMAKVIVALLTLILANWLFSSVIWRLDLTQDKRYTLSPITTTFIEENGSNIHIEILLDGDLNPGFMRLHQAIKDMATEFHQLNKTLTVSYYDFDKLDASKKRAFLAHWQKLGITPINVVDTDADGKTIQKRLFPWAIIQKDTSELAIRLLSEIPGKTGDENLNISIQNLEFKLIDGLKRFYQKNDRRIAFIEGHGELNETEVFDITTAFSNYFRIDRGAINDDVSVLDAYEAVIVAKPLKPFTESEKYVLDQYIMQGGKVLWLIDGVKISIDSLSTSNATLGFYQQVNLEDQLFKYGVRVNPGLVEDMQCVLIPINTALKGQKSSYHPMPWYYSPLFQTNPNNVISRNIAPVKGEFASAIDIVNSNDKQVKKTVLLSTSSRTKYTQVPLTVNLEMAGSALDQSYFNTSYLPTAMLLEGKFTSVFTNRIKPKDIRSDKAQLSNSKATAMIVVSDGDVIKNDIVGFGANRQIVPLGYDRVSKREFYGNKDFLLNCINYLTDDKGWMTLRNKVIKLRLLNKAKINEERHFWVFVNMFVPLTFVLLIWLVFYLLRRRKYSRKFVD